MNYSIFYCYKVSQTKAMQQLQQKEITDMVKSVKRCVTKKQAIGKMIQKET